MSDLHVSPRPLLVAALALAAGCNVNGLFELGEYKDTLVPCEGATSTYLRSTSLGTEILVLGSASPTETVPADFPRCFVYGRVEHDTSTHLETGVYHLGAGGVGEALHQYEYDFRYQPNTPIIQRDGSDRTKLPSIVAEPLRIQPNGSDITVTLDGTAMRFRPIGVVADAIDVNTQAGAEDAFRLVNLALFTGNVRLLGFGGGGMTQYVATPGEFTGIIRNRFTVSVQSNLTPHTDIVYYQFEDLTGVVLDGRQQSLVNISGNGPMAGTVSFVVLGAGGVTDTAFRGGILYDDIGISNGNASSGTFGMNFSVGGNTLSYTVPVSFAIDLDLRRVLPELAP